MWNSEKIENLLRRSEDLKYREFHGGLTKTRYERIGVRVPVLRALAKQIIKSGEWEDFLSVRPIVFYEHAMLTGIVSASVKEPYEDKIERLKEFAAFIDDWAVCDITCSSLNCKDERLLADMIAFASAPDVWLARMGIVVITGEFSDKDHIDAVRQAIDGITAQGYYIDMAVGWLICTAESHCEGAGLTLMKTSHISQKVKKIAASKMRDSYRVSEASKREATEIAHE